MPVLLHAELLVVAALAAGALCLTASRMAARAQRAWAARACAESGEMLAVSALRVGAQARVALLTSSGASSLGGRVSLVDRGLLAVDLEGIARLNPGAPVMVTLLARGGLLRFYSSVKQADRSGPGQRVYLARPQWVERANQRQNYRVAVAVPVTIWRDRPPADGSSVCRGAIIDLSPGGCRLGTLSPLEPSTRIRVRLPAGMLSICELDADVLECTEGASTDRFLYLARCRFVNVPGATRVALARYCFLLAPADAKDPTRDR